jgi:BirA family biotin operon repressor/biotin-[acetyl-CoA-carboxylase] ligase
MFIIHRFSEIGSSNDIAKDYDFNSVIVADSMKSGRGRFKRRWIAPKGGLWFSIILQPKRNPFEYTFIACLSVLQSIQIGEIKWPNDIIYKNKKVCGILSEMISDVDRQKLILGIGINVNNNLPGSLKDLATSLKEIKKEKIDKKELFQKVLFQIEKNTKKDFDDILSEYKTS